MQKYLGKPYAFFYSQENRFFIAAFCIVWSYSILKPLRYSLAATSLGMDYLPSLKIASLIFLGWYSLAGTKLRKASIFTISALVCFSFSLHSLVSHCYFDAFLCIALEIIPTITLSLLWAMMHSYFDEEQAQSFYPRVCLVGEIGSLSSLGTGLFLSYYRIPTFILAFLAGVTYLIAWYLLRETSLSHDSKKLSSTNNSSGWSIIGILMGAQFLGIAIKINTEYAFLRALEQYCRDTSCSLSFSLYLFSTVLHLSSAILLYTTSRVQKRYYFWAAPACALFSSIALLFCNTFASITLSFFLISLTYFTLYYPSLMLLYKTMPTSVQHSLQNSVPLYSKMSSWILASSACASSPLTLLIASSTWLIGTLCMRPKK